MNQEDYTKQLEDTIESLNKKLEEVSYFKPMWCQEDIPGITNFVIPRPGITKDRKLWVLQIMGNPVCDMYKKKVLGYIKGSPKQRSNWANKTISKEVMAYICPIPDNRYIPLIFGHEYEWQPDLEACKKFVNRLLFGVDHI